MNRQEYDQASKKCTQASRAFRIATEAYRAQTIGDAEFLAARKVHEHAIREWESAESAHAAWEKVNSWS